MNKLLEESEQLIFRAAVTISETDLLIERSRPLLRHQRHKKSQTATDQTHAVGDRTLPNGITLQWRRDRMVTSQLPRSSDDARILIIDDDTALLTALADTLKLRLEGIVIDTANSGSDGTARAERNNYNIILCDVSMPDIDGLSLLPQLKKISPDSIIIMMTGHGDESTRRTAACLGALELIHKPFDRPSLVRTLKQALQAQQST
jgi:CheY-like chemotaxis protein